jgi:hypothetical protein
LNRKVEEYCQGRAALAQAEFEAKLKAGYQPHEAEEVARLVVQGRPETDGLSEEIRDELAEKEADYQKNPPAQVG